MTKKITIKIKKGSLVLLSFVLVIIIAGESCSSASYSTGDIKMEKIEFSEQYADGKFSNYQPSPAWGIGKMLPIIWDFIFVDNERKPKVDLPMQLVDFNQLNNAAEDELKVTWIGHSSQIINIDGKIILTDPIYEESTAVLGPSRFNGPVPLNLNDIPEIDLVVISHNHYDHLNSTTLQAIHNRVKQFIVPLMVGAQLEEFGIPREKIIEMDWWDEVNISENFMVAFTPAQHFSGRGLFDRDETLWGSYVIKGPYHKIYFSGDSGYFKGFKEIGDKYGPFDYTFMECGAYNEKWRFVHMMPEETVQAHIDLKGKILQPIHWGTFNLALHAWYDPMVRIAKAADSAGVKLSTPIVGETITINENLTTKRWWENIIEKKEIVAGKK